VPGAAPLKVHAGSALTIIPLPWAINGGGTVTGS
jgi:hypothetical protein